MAEVLNKQVIDIKKSTNIIITTLIIIGAFLVPTFLAKVFYVGKYQQIITGTIVNLSLVLTALYTKGTVKTISIATLPSMSTILSGVLFSGITLYSKLMIPFIWIGNFSLIFMYKYLFLQKNKNYVLAAISAIILKVTIIYLGFRLMGLCVNIPEKVYNVLSVSMGYTQLLTATCGSILAYIVKQTKILKN